MWRVCIIKLYNGNKLLEALETLLQVNETNEEIIKKKSHESYRFFRYVTLIQRFNTYFGFVEFSIVVKNTHLLRKYMVSPSMKFNKKLRLLEKVINCKTRKLSRHHAF